MFKILTIFMLVSMVCKTVQLNAQNHETDSANIAWHISALANDTMLGRRAGSPEEAKAAEYIAAQFELYGLKPYKPVSDSYLIPYSYGYPNYGECVFKVDDREYKYRKDFGAIASSAEGSVKGKLVTYSEFNGMQDLKGNYIPFIDLYTTSKRKSMKASDVNKLLSEVTASGASAVVLYNSAGYDKRHKLFSLDSINKQPVPVIYLSRNEAAKLKNTGAHDAVIEVELSHYITSTANVAGYIDNGSDKTVVVGAHYDHVGYGGRGSEKGVCNGADDNASGTAAMLELSRWAATRSDLKFNYLFIAFSAEEQGLIGSKHWCNLPEVKNREYYWMMNLDMVGRLNWNGKNEVSILASRSAKEWKKIIPAISHDYFDVKFLKGAPPFSDHAPFLENKIPVIYLTTGLPPEYHTPDDDTETINFAGQAAILQYMRDIVMAVEQTDDLTFKRISGLQNTLTATKMFLFK